MNFSRPMTISPTQKLNEEMAMLDILDRSLVSAREADAAERYKDRPKSLGAGRVGHPMAEKPWDRGCERALHYEMKQYKKFSEFPAHLYRIFTMGHMGEDLVVENLRLAGFTIVTHDKDDNQFGFALCFDDEGHPMYKGYGDGIIIDGPATIGHGDATIKLNYPMLWENKMLNHKGFEAVKTEGVEKAKPVYYGQIQSYQNFLNLYTNPALLTVCDRNTGHIYPEFVRFNQKHTQAIINRASKVIEARGPLQLERAAKSWEKIPCKWCDYREHCKKDEEERATSTSNPTAEAPSWLSNSGE